MGMFFSDSNFDDEARNFDTSVGVPSTATSCCSTPAVSTVGGYEVGIDISESTVFVLGADGPSGWTNFGGNLNHLVGYIRSPLPTSSSGTVLGTVQLLLDGPSTCRSSSAPPTRPASARRAGHRRWQRSHVLIGLRRLRRRAGGRSLNRPPPPLTDEVQLASVKSLFE